MAINPELASLTDQLRALSLTDQPLAPPETASPVLFPAEWYYIGYDKLAYLLRTAVVGGGMPIKAAIQAINDLLVQYQIHLHRQPLVQDVMYSGADFYKLFGWSHLEERYRLDGEGFPEYLTIQFALWDTFPEQEFFLAIRTLFDRFCAANKGIATLPVWISNTSAKSKACHFGLIATLEQKKIQVRVEFITRREQECFSYLDSVHIRKSPDSDPAMYAHFGKEKWLQDLLDGVVDLPAQSCCQTEKLLDYIRLGFSPSPYAIELFNLEYAEQDFALDELFERQRAHKSTPEQFVELFRIAALLQKNNPFPFFARNFAKLEKDQHSLYCQIGQLLVDGKVTLEQFFASEEKVCRIMKTLPLIGRYSERPQSLTVADHELILLLLSSQFVRPKAKTLPPTNAVLEVKQLVSSWRHIANSAPLSLKVHIAAGVSELLATFDCPCDAPLELSPSQYVRLLFTSRNPVCREAGFSLSEKLAEKERKELISTFANSDPQLALRLIASVQVSDNDIKKWVATFSLRELLFEQLMRQNVFGWVQYGFEDAMAIYKAAPTKNLLVGITRQDSAKLHALPLARAWSSLPREERKGEIPLFFPILLQPDVVRELPQFLGETIADIPTPISHPHIELLRTSFAKLHELLLEPLLLLHFIKLYQEVCKATLSEQVKDRARAAYQTVAAPSEVLREWYERTLSPQASLSACVKQKRWPQAADLLLANVSLLQESLAVQVAEGLLTGSAPNPKQVFALISTGSCNNRSLWERAIQAFLHNPVGYFEGMQSFFAVRDKMGKNAKKNILKLFVDNLSQENVKQAASIFAALYACWQAMQGQREQKLLARTLLTLSDQLGQNDFARAGNLMRTALEGFGNFDIARPSLDSFLQGAKRHYQNPLECDVVVFLFKQLLEIKDARVEAYVVPHLASYPYSSRMNIFAGLLAHYYREDLQNGSLEKLVGEVIEKGDLTSRLDVFTRLLPVKCRVQEALSTHYPRLLQETLEKGDHKQAQFVLTLDLFVEPFDKSKRQVASCDALAALFMRSFAQEGATEENRKFLDKLAMHFVAPHFVQPDEQYFVLDFPAILREHYTVDSQEHFQRILSLRLMVKRENGHVLQSELAFQSLKTSLIKAACVESGKVTGTKRAALLNTVAFMLSILIDSYPTYDLLLDLLQRYHDTVISDDSLYPDHAKMFHVVCMHAFSRGLLIDYGTHAASVQVSEKRLHDLETKLGFVSREGSPQLKEELACDLGYNIVLWQQHQLGYDFVKRRELVEKFLAMWVEHPKESEITKVSHLFEVMLFPYVSRLVDSDERATTIAVFDALLKIFDRFASKCPKVQRELNVMVMNQHTVAPVAMLTPIMNLFLLISESSAFAHKQQAYVAIAKKIMARIGSKRTLFAAHCSIASVALTNALLKTYVTLESKTHIRLVDEWMKELSLIAEPTIRAQQLVNLGQAITKSGIIAKFTNDESKILASWLMLFSSFTRLPFKEELMGQVRQLPFFKGARTLT